MPFLNVHNDPLTTMKAFQKVGDIDLKEVDDYLDEDLRLNMMEGDCLHVL